MLFKTLFLFSAIVVVLGLNQCATIITGFKQKVPIVSSESGSEVYINDHFYDTTPCVIKVRRSWKKPPYIEVRKKGFWPENVTLKKKFNEPAILNFILLWNWAIDASTGAIFRYQQPDTLILKPRKSKK